MSLYIEYYTLHPFKSSMVTCFQTPCATTQWLNSTLWGSFVHACIWMPFPASGNVLVSSWTPRVHEQTRKIDRKGGSSSAARENQCGTRSTRLVKSSETVDKSKPRDIWTYETYVISLGTVRFRVWSSYSQGQIHPGALRVRMMRCLLGFDTDELIKLLIRLGTFDVQLSRAPRIGYAVQEAQSRRLDVFAYSHHMHRDENGNHRLKERRSQMAANEEKTTTARTPLDRTMWSCFHLDWTGGGLMEWLEFFFWGRSCWDWGVDYVKLETTSASKKEKRMDALGELVWWL